MEVGAGTGVCGMMTKMFLMKGREDSKLLITDGSRDAVKLCELNRDNIIKDLMVHDVSSPLYGSISGSIAVRHLQWEVDCGPVREMIEEVNGGKHYDLVVGCELM